jgi:hypothetical protein
VLLGFISFSPTSTVLELPPGSTSGGAMSLLSNIACTGLLVIGTSIFPTTVVASDFEGIKQVKVVWDITVGDEKVFTDRIGLIRETAENLKDRGL